MAEVRSTTRCGTPQCWATAELYASSFGVVSSKGYRKRCDFAHVTPTHQGDDEARIEAS